MREGISITQQVHKPGEHLGFCAKTRSVRACGEQRMHRVCEMWVGRHIFGLFSSSLLSFGGGRGGGFCSSLPPSLPLCSSHIPKPDPGLGQVRW